MRNAKGLSGVFCFLLLSGCSGGVSVTEIQTLTVTPEPSPAAPVAPEEVVVSLSQHQQSMETLRSAISAGQKDAQATELKKMAVRAADQICTASPSDEVVLQARREFAEGCRIVFKPCDGGSVRPANGKRIYTNKMHTYPYKYISNQSFLDSEVLDKFLLKKACVDSPKGYTCSETTFDPEKAQWAALARSCMEAMKGFNKNLYCINAKPRLVDGFVLSDPYPLTLVVRFKKANPGCILKAAEFNAEIQ